MSIYLWCHCYVAVILINSLAACRWFLRGTLNVKLTFFVASFVSIYIQKKEISNKEEGKFNGVQNLVNICTVLKSLFIN